MTAGNEDLRKMDGQELAVGLARVQEQLKSFEKRVELRFDEGFRSLGQVMEARIEPIHRLLEEERRAGSCQETRITQLEVATKDAIPKVADLDRRVTALETDRGHNQRANSRWWSVAEKGIAALLGVLAGRYFPRP